MPTSSVDRHLCWLLCAIIAAGCEKPESIETYTVPTHESLQTPEFLSHMPREERMFAAIVSKGTNLWFFKLQGLPDPVAACEPEFRTFLKSIHFTTPDRIEWQLPANWQEKPGKGMRYATLAIGSEPPLEVSVTTFPAQNENLNQNLLDNINRWRGQLDLPFLQLEDLPTHAETIQSPDVVVTFVSLLGKSKPQAPQPPFAQEGAGAERMGAPAEPGKDRPSSKPQHEPADVTYDKPEGWSVAPLVPLSMATFEVKEGERKVTIAVSRAGGSPAGNLNRWRGQVSLEPLPEAEIARHMTSISVGSRKGNLVEVTGKGPDGQEKSILGVIIPDGDISVFVKLSGDPELAAKERSRFEAFAKSIRF